MGKRMWKTGVCVRLLLSFLPVTMCFVVYNSKVTLPDDLKPSNLYFLKTKTFYNSQEQWWLELLINLNWFGHEISAARYAIEQVETGMFWVQTKYSRDVSGDGFTQAMVGHRAIKSEIKKLKASLVTLHNRYKSLLSLRDHLNTQAPKADRSRRDLRNLYFV